MEKNSITPTNGTYTHQFHPYPAKFPPDVVRELILKYSAPGETVLDPFCGSGTTLVEAVLEGRNAIGIELNPIGALISQAKSLHYTDADVSVLQQFTKRYGVPQLMALTAKGKVANSIFPNKEHWFPERVAAELGAIKHAVALEVKRKPRIGLLLKTAFSRIIVPVSNQDTETRYARIEKEIRPEETVSLFLKTCRVYANKILASSRRTTGNNSAYVYQGDVLDNFPKIQASSVDMIVTSPPYINSFDYYLYHKQRMHWLDEDPRRVRKLEIGSHHRIDGQDYNHALADYKQSMQFFLKQSSRTLKPGRCVVILIGDGIVKNKIVAAGELISELAIVNKLECIKIDSSELTHVSKTFIKEKARLAKKQHHVIVLRKHSSRLKA